MNYARERSKKRLFTKEVRQVMYGCGDVANPAHDTVELMEELLETYIADMCKKVQKLNPKPKTTDFLHVLRRDPKKLARARELLMLNQEIKNATKAFAAPEAQAKKTRT